MARSSQSHSSDQVPNDKGTLSNYTAQPVRYCMVSCTRTPQTKVVCCPHHPVPMTRFDILVRFGPPKFVHHISTSQNAYRILPKLIPATHGSSYHTDRTDHPTTMSAGRCLSGPELRQVRSTIRVFCCVCLLLQHLDLIYSPNPSLTLFTPPTLHIHN